MTRSEGVREGERQKRRECDELSRHQDEVDAVLERFHSNVRQRGGQMEFIARLLNEYLTIKELTGKDELAAREFDYLKQVDPDVESGAQELEWFGQTVAGALKPAEKAVALSSSASSGGDALDELDATLKGLVGREQKLTPTELEQLMELGGMLEDILAQGHVELGSGKFRYLSGTLDAVRTVLLHKLMADDDSKPVRDSQPVVQSYSPPPPPPLPELKPVSQPRQPVNAVSQVSSAVSSASSSVSPPAGPARPGRLPRMPTGQRSRVFIGQP